MFKSEHFSYVIKWSGLLSNKQMICNLQNKSIYLLGLDFDNKTWSYVKQESRGLHGKKKRRS